MNSLFPSLTAMEDELSEHKNKGVYRPYIQCSKYSSVSKNKYLSKVIGLFSGGGNAKRRDDVVGELIKSIFVYSDFFSTTTTSDNINIGTLDESITDDVDNEDPDTVVYKSITVRDSYGNKPFFLELMNSMKRIEMNIDREFVIDTFSHDMTFIIKMVVVGLIHILKGIQKLQQDKIGVVHFNINEFNILHNVSHGTPVLSDFGVAFQISDIYDNSTGDVEYGTIAEYIHDIDGGTSYYCLDVILLSYIINIIIPREKLSSESAFNPRTLVMTQDIKDELIHVCADTMASNELFSLRFFNENEKKEFITEWTEFISDISGGLVDSLVKKLIQEWKFWDVYSTCSVFFIQINKFFESRADSSSWMKKYNSILKSIISSVPDTNSQETRDIDSYSLSTIIMQELSVIDRTDYILEIKLKTDS
jgi:hypothetical protein